jgi:hypothetical protein
MLILVLGHHTSQTRLDVVKALKDAGAHAGQESDQYQDMDFRRLNENHLDWKNPEPAPFDKDAYDALYLEREDEHDTWVLSDPRMLFYVEDFLSLAQSHRNKSRIIVVHADIDKTATDIAQIHNLTQWCTERSKAESVRPPFGRTPQTCQPANAQTRAPDLRLLTCDYHF